MKQLEFCLPILLVLNSISMLYSMQPQTRWKGRAVVMSKDPQTQQWRVLLGHRPLNIDKNDVWADFDEESRGDEKGNVVAARAVNAQTKNVFGITPAMLQYGVEGDKPAPNMSGDWFQFIPLGVAGNPAFIAGQDLHKKASTNLRDDFIWVNANDIIDNQPIIHTRTKKPITISRGVHAALRKLLPGAIQWLNQRLAGGQPTVPLAQPTPSPQPVRSVPVTQPKAPTQQAIDPMKARAPWGPNKPGYIYFYNAGQPYYEFTNFYASPVTIDGKLWPTTEHYFQAQKYPSNVGLQERIRKAATPREAFNITREPGNDRFKVPNWDVIKYDVMLKAVRNKFNQLAHLKDLLLKTGNAILVENAGPNDSVWGAGGDYMGTNHLGRILMHVRDELRSGQQKSYIP